MLQFFGHVAANLKTPSNSATNRKIRRETTSWNRSDFVGNNLYSVFVETPASSAIAEMLAEV